MFIFCGEGKVKKIYTKRTKNEMSREEKNNGSEIMINKSKEKKIQ